MSTSGSSAEGLQRTLSEVRDHPKAARLAALAFDVLSQQAEGRALFTGRRQMRARAGTHRVARADAETAFGNVLNILERGPERSDEWQIVAAFAVFGLEGRLNQANAAEKREIVERFARHADWLELSTPYDIYAFVPHLISDANQDILIEALEGAVLASGDESQRPSYRARAALRIHVLSTLDREAARVALARALEAVPDAFVKVLALHVLGSEALPETTGFELKGTWGRVPRLSLGRVLQYFIGWPLLVSFGRFCALGFGFERSARVRLEEGAVHVRRETFLFGRLVRSSDASYALKQLDSAMRVVSLPLFQVLFGALSLAAAVIVSAIWLSDGIARHDSALLRAAGIALVAGVGLDLLFAGWGRLRRARAGFELFFEGKRVVSLRRVDPERAQAMVDQIARRR